MTFCQLLVLNRTEFDRIVSDFPEVHDKIRQIASDRLADDVRRSKQQSPKLFKDSLEQRACTGRVTHEVSKADMPAAVTTDVPIAVQPSVAEEGSVLESISVLPASALKRGSVMTGQPSEQRQPSTRSSSILSSSTFAKEWNFQIAAQPKWLSLCGQCQRVWVLCGPKLRYVFRYDMIVLVLMAELITAPLSMAYTTSSASDSAGLWLLCYAAFAPGKSC